MIGWNRTERSPIGLDIGRRRVKAVQATRSKGRWQVSMTLVSSRTQRQDMIDAEEATALAHMLQRNSFIGKSLILLAPRESVRTSMIELPPVGSGAPIERLARMEMARIHKMDSDAMEMAAWELPRSTRGDGDTRMIATACTHQAIDPLIAELTSCGLDVMHVVAPTQALTHALGGRLERDRIHAIVDLGWSSARVVIVHLGATVYERELADCSIQQLHRSIADSLKVPDAVAETMLTMSDSVNGNVRSDQQRSVGEVLASLRLHADRLAESIAAAFTYTSHQYKDALLGSVRLIGGGAEIASFPCLLAKSLTQLLGQDVEVDAGVDNDRSLALARGMVELWHG